MKQMIVRGCPASIRSDAWWLGVDGRGSARPMARQTHQGNPHRTARALIGAFVGLLAAADLLFWGVVPGLSLAVFAVLLCAAAQLIFVQSGTGRRAAVDPIALGWGWLGVGLAALSLVEKVQPLSVLLMVLACLHFGARLVAGSAMGAVIRTALVLPVWGMVQEFRDTLSLPRRIGGGPAIGATLGGLARDWAVPLALGLVFLWLIVAANPMVQAWVSGLDGVSLPQDLGLRALFWGIMAFLVWPALRLQVMRPRTARAVGLPSWTAGVLNARSVLRALVIFNALFALQTLMDAAYLWGGVRLPEGLSYAEYAHRGAYPLMAAALLAGAFVLVARQVTGGARLLRLLLLIWVIQTLFLNLSAILRLDLYIQAYGLTHLRFAALVWMAVVAAGLGLILWQVLAGLSAGWVILRGLGLALLAIWGVSMVNVDGLIARTNLDRAQVTRVSPDWSYLCGLGDGAAPALRAWAERSEEPEHCARTPRAPADWREWGYRNWRLRRNLAAMQDGDSQ